MANMRNTTKGINTKMNPVINHEGAVSHGLNPLEELFSKVLGSFFGESTYYENRNAEGEFKNLQNLVAQVPDADKEYVLKIAELGRRSNMISYPLQLLTVAFNDDRFKGDAFSHNGVNGLRQYSDNIILRALDITEILSSQLAIYDDRPLPMQLRKSLKAKLESFDNFKLSKGLQTNSAVKLADAIKLLRPKPFNKERAAFYQDIINGKVKSGAGKKQVKTEMSKKGIKKDSDNTGVIESIFESNLQTIVKFLVSFYNQGVFNDEKALDFVVAKMKNAKDVQNSRILPFRFYSAYKEVCKLQNNLVTKRLKDALETALDLSIVNLEDIPGNTAILVDVSGSMDHKISDKAVTTAKEIALVLGAIAYKKGFCDLFIFADGCAVSSEPRSTSVLSLVSTLANFHVGGGTNLYNALNSIEKYAKQNKTQYDNLILLSDNDCYGYDQRSNTIAFGNSWRSAGNADMQIKQMLSTGVIKKVWINNLLGNSFVVANTNKNTINLITGFSEQFVSIISIYNSLGNSNNLKKVIDEMLANARGKNRKAS